MTRLVELDGPLRLTAMAFSIISRHDVFLFLFLSLSLRQFFSSILELEFSRVRRRDDDEDNEAVALLSKKKKIVSL